MKPNYIRQEEISRRVAVVSVLGTGVGAFGARCVTSVPSSSAEQLASTVVKALVAQTGVDPDGSTIFRPHSPTPPLARAQAVDLGHGDDVHSDGQGIYALFSRVKLGCAPRCAERSDRGPEPLMSGPTADVLYGK